MANNHLKITDNDGVSNEVIVPVYPSNTDYPHDTQAILIPALDGVGTIQTPHGDHRTFNLMFDGVKHSLAIGDGSLTSLMVYDIFNSRLYITRETNINISPADGSGDNGYIFPTTSLDCRIINVIKKPIPQSVGENIYNIIVKLQKV